MKKRECEEVPLHVLLSPSELSRANCAALGGHQGSTREGAGSGNVGHLLSCIYPGTAAALKHWGQVRGGQRRQGAAGPVAQ